MRTTPHILLAGSLLLPLVLRAQMSTPAGTGITVDQGTNLRITTPLIWTIESGSNVVNDGIIELGPEADLMEQPGGAITGSGIERTTRTLVGPLSAVDPGGLGCILTTNASPGLTLVQRGHLPYADYSGSTSIARWCSVSPTNNSGLNATLAFRYDLAELNGVPETAQILHRNVQDDVWAFLPSAVETTARTVTTTGLDGLGLFTTFDMDLPNGIAYAGSGSAFRILGNGSERPVLSVPVDASVGLLEIRSATGSVVRTSGPQWRPGSHPVDVAQLAPGVYHLIINGTTTLPLLRP